MLLANLPLLAQRNYANRSVLADGNWYKIGVVREGVYRIDGNFLQNLGITSQYPLLKLGYMEMEVAYQLRIMALFQ